MLYENSVEDVSKEVEECNITQNLATVYKMTEPAAHDLAEQITQARNENAKIREQKLFLLFNGNHLMSSDGKFLQNAVSGKAVSVEEKLNSASTTGVIISTKTFNFDNSYARQAIVNEGALPQGLYSISCKESGSLTNGNLKKHLLKKQAWGYYHWQLIPDEQTNTRNRKRNSFTIHGGSVPGSAGCIDLTSGDTKFREYLKSLDIKTIFVYVRYSQTTVSVEKTIKKLYPPTPLLY